MINKKFISKFLEKQLRHSLYWMNKHLLREFFFVIISLTTISFSFLPYTNLLFTRTLVIFLILVLMFVMFNFSWKTIIYFCVSFILLAFLFNLFGLLTLSQIIGNYVYGFLVLAVSKFIVSI